MAFFRVLPSRIGLASRICCSIQECFPLIAAKYCRISFVLSVFPAPLSPLQTENKFMTHHSSAYDHYIKLPYWHSAIPYKIWWILIIIILIIINFNDECSPYDPYLIPKKYGFCHNPAHFKSQQFSLKLIYWQHIFKKLL